MPAQARGAMWGLDGCSRCCCYVVAVGGERVAPARIAEHDAELVLHPRDSRCGDSAGSMPVTSPIDGRRIDARRLAATPSCAASVVGDFADRRRIVVGDVDRAG